MSGSGTCDRHVIRRVTKSSRSSPAASDAWQSRTRRARQPTPCGSPRGCRSCSEEPGPTTGRGAGSTSDDVLSAPHPGILRGAAAASGNSCVTRLDRRIERVRLLTTRRRRVLLPARLHDRNSSGSPLATAADPSLRLNSYVGCASAAAATEIEPRCLRITVKLLTWKRGTPIAVARHRCELPTIWRDAAATGYRPLRLNSSRCESNHAMTSLRFQRLCLPIL